MLLLDTNVISEMMRVQPEPRVRDWLDSQSAPSLYISAVTEAELRHGLALMPKGRRRKDLLAELDDMLARDFEARVLPFDRPVALAFASIAAERRAAGRPIEKFDCQIAAIARSRGAAIATRDVGDFTGCGVEVINPWVATN